MKDSNGRVGQYSGELRLTDSVLDSGLTPLTKLALAGIEYFQPFAVTIGKLEKLLPARRREIPAAIRAAETGGFVSAERPTKRKRGTALFDGPSVYTLAAEATPSLNRYTSLRLQDLDGSATRWMLRSVYEREQAMRGAVCLPDGLAAAKAGMTTKAVRLAREGWRKRGLLTLIKSGRRGHPAIFTLNGSPYAARPGEFDPDHYALHDFELADERFQAWTTKKQLRALLGVIQRNDDDSLARAYAEHFGQDGGLVCSRTIFAALHQDSDGALSFDPLTLGLAERSSHEAAPIPA